MFNIFYFRYKLLTSYNNILNDNHINNVKNGTPRIMDQTGVALTIYLLNAAQGLQSDSVLSKVCPTILSQSSLRMDADSVILQISFFKSQI